MPTVGNKPRVNLMDLAPYKCVTDLPAQLGKLFANPVEHSLETGVKRRL